VDNLITDLTSELLMFTDGPRIIGLCIEKFRILK
jgi:hypothetical protein